MSRLARFGSVYLKGLLRPLGTPSERPSWFVAAGVIITALVLGAYSADVFRSPELDTVDARFDVRGDRPRSDSVVVVGIDDATFAELDTRWPFPRSLHARVVDRLRAAGARVIAYDVQFTEPTTPREDNALIDSIAAAGNVVLATTEPQEDGTTTIFGGDDVLRDIGARPSYSGLPNDPGGVIRRFPFDERGLRSFAIVAAESARGRPLGRDEFDGASAWIDYAGGPRSVDRIPFWRVARGRFRPEEVRGKVVVVGAVAPVLQDVHPTSTASEDLMAGPEIQAHAIVTALDGFPLEEAPTALDVVLIVLFGMLAPLIALRLPAIGTAAVALLAAAVYLVAAQWAFGAGVIVPVVYPLAALALGMVAALLLQGLVEAFERRRVHSIFARFVPGPVVDELLAQADDGVRLGGVSRVVTVVFTDLRGFTTFSESRPPELVIEVLNRYLTAMTKIIMDNGGTVTNYIGDGILAVFGTPVPYDDHADRALDAARLMVGDELDEFNEWMRAEGISDGFKMGVGLNSGSVMAGNVGSEERLEYTTIGDVVNTASRIEGMTKGTPSSIFVAESTRAMLEEIPDDLFYVDEFQVRGKQTGIAIWTVPDGYERELPDGSAAGQPSAA